MKWCNKINERIRPSVTSSSFLLWNERAAKESKVVFLSENANTIGTMKFTLFQVVSPDQQKI